MKKVLISSVCFLVFLLSACANQSVTTGPSKYTQCVNIKRQIAILGGGGYVKASDYQRQQSKKYLREEYEKLDCATVLSHG